MKQAGAELNVHTISRMREQIGPKASEDRLKRRNRKKRDNEDIQCAQPAMDQHLVDDHLEEQWRDETEELKKKRCKQDLAEKPAIFADGAQEPGNVKAARQIAEPHSSGHQE